MEPYGRARIKYVPTNVPFKPYWVSKDDVITIDVDSADEEIEQDDYDDVNNNNDNNDRTHDDVIIIEDFDDENETSSIEDEITKSIKGQKETCSRYDDELDKLPLNVNSETKLDKGAAEDTRIMKKNIKKKKSDELRTDDFEKAQRTMLEKVRNYKSNERQIVELNCSELIARNKALTLAKEAKKLSKSLNKKSERKPDKNENKYTSSEVRTKTKKICERETRSSKRKLKKKVTKTCSMKSDGTDCNFEKFIAGQTKKKEVPWEYEYDMEDFIVDDTCSGEVEERTRKEKVRSNARTKSNHSKPKSGLFGNVLRGERKLKKLKERNKRKTLKDIQKCISKRKTSSDEEELSPNKVIKTEQSFFEKMENKEHGMFYHLGKYYDL